MSGTLKIAGGHLIDPTHGVDVVRDVWIRDGVVIHPPGDPGDDVAAHLVAEAELIARRLQLTRVITATSNDNLPSLYFFQRHGYRVTAVVPDAFAQHSKLPQAPGFGGIPVMDEIQLEKTLT